MINIELNKLRLYLKFQYTVYVVYAQTVIELRSADVKDRPIWYTLYHYDDTAGSSVTSASYEVCHGSLFSRLLAGQSIHFSVCLRR